MRKASQSRTPLQRYRFIRHFAYCVRYSVVPTNSQLLNMTLYSSVVTRLVYNGTEYFAHVLTEFDCIFSLLFCLSFWNIPIRLHAFTDIETQTLKDNVWLRAFHASFCVGTFSISSSDNCIVNCDLKGLQQKNILLSIKKNANCGCGEHERVVQISKNDKIKKKTLIVHLTY